MTRAKRRIIGIVVLVLVCGAVYLGYGIRGAAQRMIEWLNMSHLGMALNSYDDTHGRLPPAALVDANGTPLLSWRVLILPQISEENLYAEFRLDEPWDSPHNAALIPKMPDIFAPKHRKHPRETGLTYYQALIGPGLPWGTPCSAVMPKHPENARVPLLVDGPHAVPWTKPEDVIFDPDAPPELGGGWDKLARITYCNTMTVWILKPIEPRYFDFTRAHDEP